jgi:hypothetical protein
VTGDYTGWHARGCFDFLPGSVWSGATGGSDGRIVSSLENTLIALREGRSCPTVYDTRFLLQWPEHLGGGQLEIEFQGAMTLVPLMGAV